MNGSSLVLGACETDLVPPLSDILDEHLSISAAFLTKGAAEILGGLWRVDIYDTEEIIERCCNKLEILRDEIWNWQKDKIEEYKKDKNQLHLFTTLSFRVVGVK